MPKKRYQEICRGALLNVTYDKIIKVKNLQCRWISLSQNLNFYYLFNNAAHLVKQIIEKTCNNNMKTEMLFIVLEQAFDSITKNLLIIMITGKQQE